MLHNFEDIIILKKDFHFLIHAAYKAYKAYICLCVSLINSAQLYIGTDCAALYRTTVHCCVFSVLLRSM